MVVLVQLFLFLAAALLRGRFLFGTHLRVDKRTQQLIYRYEGKRGWIVRLHVGIRQQNGIPFIVKPERWYHRLLKGLGIASEIRIGNAKFNRKYFITTDYPGHLERALESNQLLERLRELFALPVLSLHATPKKIWCVVNMDKLSTHSEEKNEAGTESELYSYIQSYINALLRVSEASNLTSGYDPAGLVRRRLGWIALLFMCAHVGLFTTGVLGGQMMYLDYVGRMDLDHVEITDKDIWIAKGLLAGAIAGGIWLFLILSIFRKSSWVGWVFVDFLLCGIIGFVLSGVFLVREANVYFPQSQQKFEQEILRKTCVLKCHKSCGKNCTRHSSYTFQHYECATPEVRASWMQTKQRTDYICAANAEYEYELEIVYWHRVPYRYYFPTKEEVFDSVSPGELVVVPVNAGALGLEWVDLDQILPK